MLIKEFLEDESNEICVTRPSNYGKTTNLVMMQEFFQMDYENEENSENRKLFEKLNIAKEVDINGQRYIDSYLGKYPVVFVDFKHLEISNNYDETINKFRYFIKILYKNYEQIKIENLDSDNDKKMWKNFLNDDIDITEGDLSLSIKFLCNCLKKILNKEVILLIDNYDLPILNAFNTNFYDEFYSFYKNVFMNIFEDHKKDYYLFKTFITGKFFISFLEKTDIYNYNVMNNKYDEFYSITDSELKKLLSELKLENKIDEKLKEYCNNNIYSCLNSTVINNTNIFISSLLFNSFTTPSTSTKPDPIISVTTMNTAAASTTNINNIVNIYNSSSVFHINNNNYNYDNNIIKCYDLFYIKEYIKNIHKSNKIKKENSEIFILIKKVFKVFENFDYLIIKYMNYLFTKWIY